MTNRNLDHGTADSHADDDDCRVHYGSHADQLDIATLAYTALAGVEPHLFGTGATLLNPAQANPIRILGIDPGLRITGFGVIEKTGNKLAYLASGCIKTDAKTSLPMRLGTIYSGLRELVAQYQPDQAVIEIVFVNVNPQSTLLLGQARGAAITALVAGGVEVAEYTALQVKQAVVGNGHADKIQVQHMVRRLLSLPGDPSADAADALACAIAHAHGGQGLGALATKGFRVRNGRMIEGK